MSIRHLGAAVLVLSLCVSAAWVQAGTEKYRLTWREDPATTMVVGWAQTSGSGATVYYDTVDHGANTGAYAYTHGVDQTRSHKAMTHQFARLTGLQPNTHYYFVVADSNSTSQRFYFKTAPSDNAPFTVIAGGDSRNNTAVRIKANKMVAKLRPLFVMFGGDMTDGNSSSEWQEWLDHWQYTTSSDGRMYPVVAARGNHEGSNIDIEYIFDVPQSRIYYALTFGQNLLRTYTLNSEDTEGGNQAAWLASDLAANADAVWKVAQYHKPMRPHVSSKSEGNSEYSAWANLFYDHGVRMVVECDSHCVKTTWPVRPYTGSGNDEGFIRDDDNGIVFLGEGTWGAPLRSANDAKTWTRDSGSFNQFKWIYVSPARVEAKTIRYENADSVGSVDDTNPWQEPTGLDVWTPSSGGGLVVLTHEEAPTVTLTQPTEGQYFESGAAVSISATVSYSGTVQSVSFYGDGALIATDSTAPYSATWTGAGDGAHTVKAVADTDGLTGEAVVNINVGAVTGTISVRVGSANDDAEERTNGTMYLDSSDLELTTDGTQDQTVGIRFTGVDLPAGATITSATIQFTVDETDSETTNLDIYGQDAADAAGFGSGSHDITNRSRTTASVNWLPVAWSSTGAAGADQRTPDLSAVVQEVVDRSDWVSGNALAFIIEGSGQRTAEAYDGVSAAAPLLEVTYELGDDPNPPPPPPTDDKLLENGVTKTNLSGAQGGETFYYLDVPANATNLTFSMTGGSGDADIYVRYGAEPTQSTWDYRPYKDGNSETVNATQATAGRWHVMVRAYTAYSGLSLTASYQISDGGDNGGDPNPQYDNTNPVAIFDNQTVSSQIPVTHGGDAGSVQVTVDISHTYIGDLLVVLKAPGGQSYTLHNRSGGSANDIQQTYTVNAGGIEANGTWILEINDNYSQDQGTLNGWSLQF